MFYARTTAHAQLTNDGGVKDEEAEDEWKEKQKAFYADGEGRASEEFSDESDAWWLPTLMPCFHPLKGWRSRVANPSGTFGIVFNESEGWSDIPLEVPCGACVGCQKLRSQSMAIRCMHEASLFENNSFLTLTYSSENMPANGGLDKQAFSKFMKRLRKRRPPGVRFFMCGEYGDQYGRPHYHAIVFNCGFADRIFFKMSGARRLYISQELDELWPFGWATLGDVSFESASYVAQYCQKKMSGERVDMKYKAVDPETGEMFEREREFIGMSRRPGLGSKWIEKFKTDVYPGDFVVVKGGKYRPPRYYDLKLPEAELEVLKLKRFKEGRKHKDDATPARLRDREACLEMSNRLKPRNQDS